MLKPSDAAKKFKLPKLCDGNIKNILVASSSPTHGNFRAFEIFPLTEDGLKAARELYEANCDDFEKVFPDEELCVSSDQGDYIHSNFDLKAYLSLILISNG